MLLSCFFPSALSPQVVPVMTKIAKPAPARSMGLLAAPFGPAPAAEPAPHFPWAHNPGVGWAQRRVPTCRAHPSEMATPVDKGAPGARWGPQPGRSCRSRGLQAGPEAYRQVPQPLGATCWPQGTALASLRAATTPAPDGFPRPRVVPKTADILQLT